MTGFFVFLKTIVFLRKSATHALEGGVSEGEALEIHCVLWLEEAAAWRETGAARGEPQSPELTGWRGTEGLKGESEAWAGANSEDVGTRQVFSSQVWLLEGSSSLWPLCVWQKVMNPREWHKVSKKIEKKFYDCSKTFMGLEVKIKLS